MRALNDGNSVLKSGLAGHRWQLGVTKPQAGHSSIQHGLCAWWRTGLHFGTMRWSKDDSLTRPHNATTPRPPRQSLHHALQRLRNNTHHVPLTGAALSTLPADIWRYFHISVCLLSSPLPPPSALFATDPPGLRGVCTHGSPHGLSSTLGPFQTTYP